MEHIRIKINYTLKFSGIGDEMPYKVNSTTVKSFHFVGMKFLGLTTLDSFVHTRNPGIQIICNITTQ